MKNRRPLLHRPFRRNAPRSLILASVLSLALAQTAAALTHDWLENPADNNFLNPANWTPPPASFTDAEIVLGATAKPTVNLSGGDTTIASVTFAAGAPFYNFNLSKSASLTLAGDGILNRTRASTGSFTGQVIRLTGGATLNFVNAASASAANATRLINNSSTIRFTDNATAGKALLINELMKRGAPSALIEFAGHSTSAGATIHNYGTATGAILRFTGNAFTGNAATGFTTIRNRGYESAVIFEGNSTLNAGTVFHNMGSASTVWFKDDAKLYGNAASIDYTSGVTVYTAITDTTTLNSTNTLINNGSFSGIYLGGRARAEDIVIQSLSGQGTLSTIFITDAFTATGNIVLAAAATGSKIIIEGNDSKVRIDGNLWFFSTGSNDPLFRIGNNTEITGHGNFTANGSSGIARTQFVIGGNAIVSRDNTGADLFLRNAGTNIGSVFTINGTAQVTNARISIAGGRLTNPDCAVIFNIHENAVFTTNRDTTLSGNFGYLNIYDHAFFSTDNATGIQLSGNYNTLDIASDNTVTTPTIRLTGANGTVNIRGDATVNITATGSSGGYAFRFGTGSNSTLNITGNATLNLGAANTANNSYINNPGTVININGNSTVNLLAANSTFNLTNTTATIAGNATVNGAGANINAFVLNAATSMRIAGNARIANGRIDLANAGADIAIEGAPDLSTATLISRATRAISLSLDENYTLTLANLTKTSGLTTLNFTGAANQTLQYNIITGTGEIAFTEDSGVRANIIHNATQTLALLNPNTITGEFVIQRGTVTANTTDTLATATLNITDTGKFSTNQTLLQLGAIAGNGNLSTTGTDYTIGLRDTVFSGNLSGNGNITLRENTGTNPSANILELRDADTQSYTGHILLQTPVSTNADKLPSLRVTGDIDLSAATLTLSQSTQLHLTLNDTTDHARLALGTLSLQSADQLRVLVPDNASFAETYIFADVLTLSNTPALALDGKIIRATQGRLTFTLNETAPDTFSLENPAKLSFTEFFQIDGITPAPASDLLAALDHLETSAANPALIDALDKLPTDSLASAVQSLEPTALTALPRLIFAQSRTQSALLSERFAAFQNQEFKNQNAPWFAVQSSRSSLDSTSTATGHTAWQHSLLVGLDHTTQNANALGLLLAYHRADATFDRSAGSLDLDSFRADVHVTLSLTPKTFLSANIGIGNHQFKTRRNVLAQQAAAKSHGNTYGAGLELTRDFTLSQNWRVSPLLRFEHETLRLDARNEHNAAAALHYPAQTLDSTTTQIALRIARQWQTAAAARWQVAAQIGWLREYSDDPARLEAAFAANAPTFTVTGPATDDDTALIRLNAQYATAKSLTLLLAYEAALSSETQTHTLSLTLSKQF